MSWALHEMQCLLPGQVYNGAHQGKAVTDTLSLTPCHCDTDTLTRCHHGTTGREVLWEGLEHQVGTGGRMHMYIESSDTVKTFRACERQKRLNGFFVKHGFGAENTTVYMKILL